MVARKDEMLQQWKEFFGLDDFAPPPDAISTVQDGVNAVAAAKGVAESTSPLEGMLLARVVKALKAVVSRSGEIAPTERISEFLHPDDEVEWSKFIMALGALVPKFTLPYLPEEKAESRFRSLIHAFMPRLAFDGSDVTVQQMAEVLGASNLKDFVDMEFMNSKFEIYLCLAHWLGENQRVNYYEIGLQKEFAADFGVR